MKLLSKTEIKEISGRPDDVSRSLDSERDWAHVKCEVCGEPGVIAIPDSENNTKAVNEEVEATLPDGSKVMVAVTHAVPNTHLLWECGKCSTKQTIELGSGK